MSKKHRNRLTQAQRKESKNSPHPEEQEEKKNSCDLEFEKSPFKQNTRLQRPWKPVEGIDDFIKNGGSFDSIDLTKKGCRIIMPDDEPWNRKKEDDRRFMGGCYPPIEAESRWPMN